MSIIKSILHQIGLSGDPAKNFTLSVPAAPDGTMKLARGNAGATTQDIMTVDADGKVAFPQGVANPNSPLGVGQTWQQPTRVIGTTYTNSTGRSIQIAFSGFINATNFRFSLLVGGLPAAYSAVGTVVNEVLTIHGIVIPAGATYVITQNGGTPTLDEWTELR